MTSNIFQKEMGKLLEHAFPISERISDAANNRYGSFQVSKKPYDFYGATKEGVLWGTEVKMIKSPRFPVHNIPMHQRDALSKLADLGCMPLLAINWRCGRASNDAILANFSDYADIEYLIISDKRKSLKPQDFPQNWFLHRIVGGWEIPDTHYLYHLL